MHIDAVTQTGVADADAASGDGTIARREFLRRAAADGRGGRWRDGWCGAGAGAGRLPAQQQEPQAPTES